MGFCPSVKDSRHWRLERSQESRLCFAQAKPNRSQFAFRGRREFFLKLIEGAEVFAMARDFAGWSASATGLHAVPIERVIEHLGGVVKIPPDDF